MNKTTNFHIWFALSLNVAALTLSSCGAVISSSTPTAVPPYIHYTPSKEFNTHLEFDYPSSWIFSEERIQDTNIIVIGLGDPRFLTVPTRAPYESHGIPSDFGSISVLIQPVKSNQPLDTQFDAYKKGHSDASWITALNEYKIKIGEYDASVLEYQIEPWNSNGYTSVMFERDIFFAFKDQLYQISFAVAEKERGGEFEKGYEYFFKSLKIAP